MNRALKVVQPKSMAVERSFDIEHINEILNHPSVRPDVADESESVLDLTVAVSDKRNILLMGDHGGCMFLYMMDCMYEVHTQILPAGRGEWAKAFAKACVEWMYTKSDALEILTRVPHGHIGAKTLALQTGFRFEFTRADCCRFRGVSVPVDILSCRLQDWITTAPFMEDLGERFHDQLHKEAERLGITAPAHENDPNHNQYVGACLKMIFGGQIYKGVVFYNRWAIASRHETIELVSTDPVRIKFDIGFLEFHGNKIEDIEVTCV